MNVQIITIIIILLFTISLATELLVDVMVIILNAFVVYVLGLRTFKEVQRGKQYMFILCGFLSIFLLLIYGNLYKYLWPFSSFLILTCILAFIFEKLRDKYGK